MVSPVTVAKKRDDLTLKDRLSRLRFVEACRILGKDGRRLIQRGGTSEIDIEESVYLGDDLFRLKLPDAVVTITLMGSARKRLHWSCTSCSMACEHVGAAFSLVLEEKMALGLAAPPPEPVAVESMSEEDLVRVALEERAERARIETMRLRSLDGDTPWADYVITSALSGRSYRVSLRGLERGESFCSCPDFRKNTLGTCKHILQTITKVKKRFSAARLRRPYRRRHIAVHLVYGEELELRLLLPRIHDPEIRRIVEPIRDRAITDLSDLLRRIRDLERRGREVLIYPDAEEYMREALFRERIRKLVDEIRRDPAKHPLRRSLLEVELLPYQLDGIAFAVGAGRAVLADDMGLGKTIQGVGVAELLAREAGISRVLVVCPASVKSQWKAEIERFSRRDCQLVLGAARERAGQYARDCFFTVCNYEQVLRDILPIESVRWDLIILDEGQRIKNWEAKTTRVVKGLRSRFAVVLSGTPLENRLDDLFSIVEFIDDRRLGPAFRFFNRHRILDERGKVLGYKNLDELRERLRPVVLRRTRASVIRDLPPRTTEIVRIAPSKAQGTMHAGWMQTVMMIAAKRYITEMDLLRLQKALLMCRMVADSTYLVDKKAPGHSTKLEKLDELLGQLAEEEDRKIVLFSEWTTMLDRIEQVLGKHSLSYVRLDGSVPQKKRMSLVRRFQRDPDCRLFLTTNAGATGLNLQAANTVVNVDLPWNPAVLEQRIGRAHRMGQKRPVQVWILVTVDTIEENMLATLSAKHELATAALDFDSDLTEVGLASGIEELRQRLELLLGARPEVPADSRDQQRCVREAALTDRSQRVEAAAGQLFTAAVDLVGSMLPDPGGAGGDAPEVAAYLQKQLEGCARETESGQVELRLRLPDRSALSSFARVLARLLPPSGNDAGPPPGGCGPASN